MKKILLFITIILIIFVGYLLFENNTFIRLNNTYIHKITELESEIELLKNPISEIESDTIVSTEMMSVYFSVFNGDSPLDNNGYTFATMEIPQNSSVLTATYKTLFNAPTEITLADGSVAQNMVPQSGLAFESVSIENGKADIYLSGEYMAMHMGDVIFRNQINKTAFQYPTVDTVAVFLNQAPFDWCITDLSDGENGCPTIPRYWIDEK